MALVVFGGCAATVDETSVNDRVKCESLRDHLVELRIAQAPNVDRAVHGAAMDKALGDTFVTDCQANLGATEVDCALNATDTAAAVACKAPTE